MIKSPRVIIFNGPPGSGKDEATKVIMERNVDAIHLMMKDSLYAATADVFEINLKTLISLCTDRVEKEIPTPRLTLENEDGTMRLFSPRQALIHTSEEIYKPLFGNEIFGQNVADKMKANNIYVISDGGFRDEINPIIERCGAENVVMIQLHRDDCDFNNDSRNYVNIPEIYTYRLYNSGKGDFYGYVVQIYNALEKYWKTS